MSFEVKMKWRDLIGALAVVAAFAPGMAFAQTYPTRPVTMVVPYAAGGAFDVLGRIMAVRMAELLGQPVIVENTTGAGGIIGVNRVIAAKPDGYTLLLGTVGTHAYNQTIYRSGAMTRSTIFAPVALFSEQPMVLEVRKDLPANTFAEFIALLKEMAPRCNTAPRARARPRILPARCSTPGSAST